LSNQPRPKLHRFDRLFLGCRFLLCHTFKSSAGTPTIVCRITIEEPVRLQQKTNIRARPFNQLVEHRRLQEVSGQTRVRCSSVRQLHHRRRRRHSYQWQVSVGRKHRRPRRSQNRLAFQKARQKDPSPVIDGFTPDQQFFIAWGQFRGDEVRPETQKLMVQSDPHPVAKFRIIGPLSNFEPFASAFQCKANSKMVRPSGPLCRLVVIQTKNGKARLGGGLPTMIVCMSERMLAQASRRRMNSQLLASPGPSLTDCIRARRKACRDCVAPARKSLIVSPFSYGIPLLDEFISITRTITLAND
jgi:hypothetical protein